MEKEAAIKTLDSETRIFPFILSIPSYRVAVPQLFENLSGNILSVTHLHSESGITIAQRRK